MSRGSDGRRILLLRVAEPIGQLHLKNLQPPLGLLSMAGVLDAMGYRVQVADMVLDAPTVEAAVALVRDTQPDLVGLSVMTINVRVFETLAAGIAEACPDIPLVVGGPHATAFPEETVATRGVTCAVLGEGEATAAVGFPDLPAGTTLKAPTVLWLHGTCGFSDKCAPTRKGADAALPVALMASQGYIGVAPDYLGMIGFGKASTMPHPYLVSEATALASLDSLRASDRVVKEFSKQVTSDRRVIAWGASQGGHATLAALLYAPYYAAEYTMTGGLALIPPADVQGQTVAALKYFNDATVGVAGTSVSLARWYGHQDKLAEVLTDTAPYHLATALPKLMDTECGLDKKKYNLQKVTDVFTQKFIDAATQKSWQGFDTWRCMFAENSFTATSVKRKGNTPILYVVGEKDELVNPAVQRKSFDTMCTAGYDMDYIECKGADHVSGALWSLPEQFAWVQDRLAGKARGSGACKRTQPVCCKGTTKGPCKK